MANEQPTTLPRADANPVGHERDAACDSYFRQVITLGEEVSDEDWAYFLARSTRIEVPARTVILKERRDVSQAWYIAKGLVRYSCIEQEREFTFGFDPEGRITGDYASFLTCEPATLSIQAVEDCELVAFRRKTLQTLYRRSPAWERIGRLQAENHVIKKLDKEWRFRVQSPEDLYKQLFKRASFILERVPQYLQASYLGVTPETLSRIRARI